MFQQEGGIRAKWSWFGNSLNGRGIGGFSQVENAADLPANHLPRLQHHINHKWLEIIPVTMNICCADERNILLSDQKSSLNKKALRVLRGH
ncbi:Uncharacterised protein [Salmonella enterica subsp. enterica serovar Bovismorbificans]|uniref:Uncharacterized protein n=1 Tax=Salmonella enterica subsp. enterica serovar Bovismorbificans TaxID=58097 RepID=A0A655E068_SALET|nr:Uncharacterised protein [Salmonella enterica subsp. enterica serovar Bovismorbificans]